MKTTVSTNTEIDLGQFFGIAKGLSHADHIAAKEYISNSGMKYLLKSPAHYQAYLNEERESSKAQNLGTAFHMLTEKDFGRVIVKPKPEDHPHALKTVDDLKARLKILGLPVTGKKDELVARVREKDPKIEMWDDLLERVTANKVIVTEEEYASLIGMSKALQAHPEASRCLSGGVAETSIFWKDPEFNVGCKGRPDYVKVSTREVIDLKTTEDASIAFAKSAFNWGYFRQAALYSDGVEAVYGFQPTFKIVAIEKSAPYGVSVFKLTDAALAFGRLEYRKALKMYLECVEIGEWPCYPETVQLLDVPEFAW